VRGGNEVEWWSIAQDWVSDIGPSRRAWSPPLIARLKELRLDQARIGFAGLSGLLRAPEGTVVVDSPDTYDPTGEEKYDRLYIDTLVKKR
jgi:hypothetical protein